MQVLLSNARPEQASCDALAVLVEEGKLEAALQDLDRALDGWIREAVRLTGFGGRQDRTLWLFTHGKIPPPRLLLVGMGRPKAGYARMEALRRAAAVAVREARSQRTRRLAVWTLQLPPQALGAVVEGLYLGAYRYEAYKTFEEPQLERVEILGDPDPERKWALRRGQVLAEATCFARDLVNAPPNEVTPLSLARTARRIARERDLRVRVYGPLQLRRMGADAILAVGRGSRQPPQLIVLEYRPPRAKRTVIIAGKGVTFDAGGLDLKTAEGMETMKSDCAGAAAVLAAMRALPDLRVPHRVVGIVGAVENLVGEGAMKPGDVVRALNGKTIEITNTDAEGRVVLADVLGYAARYQPDAIVDLATLTGSAIVALGYHAAAILGNDRALIQDLIRAGEVAGERLWELPLYEEFREAIRSEVADLRNSAGRYGGAQKGAAFIAEFVGDRPWAHLDIAGVAFLDKSEGQAPHLPKGATGFGVRTLLNWLAPPEEA
ncbi:MAG: leucyl aminopeptidase [Armatimonadota bacterium]|nr:leucyl aminopeptidase [Armatimonadota bacterium]MDR7567068.1 leucyl aminopeptidase [Armatimonadota bacterium]